MQDVMDYDRYTTHFNNEQSVYLHLLPRRVRKAGRSLSFGQESGHATAALATYA